MTGHSISARGSFGPVVFKPSAAVANALHPLKLRTEPLESDDRIFIVACADSGARCTPRVIEKRLISATGIAADANIDWRALAGAPVLDDTGAVAGVLVSVLFDGDARPSSISVQSVLTQSTIEVTVPTAPR